MICFSDKKVKRTADSVPSGQKTELERRLPFCQRPGNNPRVSLWTVIVGGDKEHLVLSDRKYPKQAEKRCK